MKEISLSQGKVALVDDEDFDYLNQYKWYANRFKYTFYAITHRRINKYDHKIYMHRLIMNPGREIHIDHKDRNGLNNQKNNLRIATYSQNNCNRKGSGASQYLGVSIRRNGKFTARIKADGYYKNLGVFDNEIDAAIAYDNAAKIYHGEFANLNIKNR